MKKKMVSDVEAFRGPNYRFGTTYMYCRVLNDGILLRGHMSALL